MTKRTNKKKKDTIEVVLSKEGTFSDTVKTSASNSVVTERDEFYKKDDYMSKSEFYTKYGLHEPKRTVLLKKLSPNAVIPQYAKDGDIGMDMTAIAVEYVADKDMYIYSTGIAIESNFNDGGFILTRSSNSKTECYLTNSVGVVDSPIYRGDIQYRYKNRTSIWTTASLNGQKAYNKAFKERLAKFPWIFNINKAIKEAELAAKKAYDETLEDAKKLKYAPYSVGDKVGQICVSTIPTVEFIETDTLSKTNRGDKGFGSTGK